MYFSLMMVAREASSFKLPTTVSQILYMYMVPSGVLKGPHQYLLKRRGSIFDEPIRLLGERYLCSKRGEYPALKVQFVKGMVSTMPGTVHFFQYR